MKTKDKRDFALMIFMAIITIIFLVYIFLPSGGKTNEKPPDVGNSTKHQNKQELSRDGISTNKTADFYSKLNDIIVEELNSIYLNSTSSEQAFEDYYVDNIRMILIQSENFISDKLLKISFYNLNDIINFDFPAELTNPMKFNIFLSLFLIKTKEEAILTKLRGLPQSEWNRIIDFDFYHLINHEVYKEYQLLPVLLYFTELVKDLHIYPTKDTTVFFCNKLENIRDLTTSKQLIGMLEILRFSQSRNRYNIQWLEYDSISADDKKEYRNLNLTTTNFLGQTYLTFPDLNNKSNNIWINELCHADSGNIELKDLNIINETPPNIIQLKKILYTNLDSQFTALIKESGTGGNKGYVSRVVAKRIDKFNSSVIAIDFTKENRVTKSFKEQLTQFGHYLKRLVSVSKNLK
jgi:hypothetical protein